MEMAFTCAACEGILSADRLAAHRASIPTLAPCHGADGRKHVAMHRGHSCRAAPGQEGGQEITVLLPGGLLVSEQS